MKVAVCRLDDIPRLGARRYRRDDGTTIAIFRTQGDEVFALRDQCPHKGGPLSQGIVFGESVSCPLHGWCISLKSGEAAAPDVGSVERFEVEVADGLVRLDCRPGEERGALDGVPAFAPATNPSTAATSPCAAAASPCTNIRPK